MGDGGLVMNPASPPPGYGAYFREAFPYYLAIGMTERQYWDGDCMLAEAFRKADKLRMERKNQALWMQGAYTYQAMCDVSPLFRTSFSKKSVKPAPYLKEPFPLDGRKPRRETEREVENERLKARLFFQNWARAGRNIGK